MLKIYQKLNWLAYILARLDNKMDYNLREKTAKMLLFLSFLAYCFTNISFMNAVICYIVISSLIELILIFAINRGLALRLLLRDTNRSIRKIMKT